MLLPTIHAFQQAQPCGLINTLLDLASLSHATLGHSMGKAPSGISPVRGGDSPVTCPCDQGKSLLLTVTLPNEQHIKVSESVVDGQE